MFDTGPLSHFARAGLLDVLRLVVGDRRAVMPAAVRSELRDGVHLHPSIHVTRTLALLCQAISEGVQAPEAVSSIADELLETDYRLPFGKGDFERWAAENLTMSP